MAQRRKAKPRKPAIPPEHAATQHFVSGVLTRGEAAPEGEELPPGATHEIVAATPDKPAVLRRKRFSLR